jgi:aerobic-type carbon monoxide dehydrogenase small subunit (CoxS/CutS family)
MPRKCTRLSDEIHGTGSPGGVSSCRAGLVAIYITHAYHGSGLSVSCRHEGSRVTTGSTGPEGTDSAVQQAIAPMLLRQCARRS